MDIRVRRGDTFWYYSKLFGIPIRLILDSNRQLPPEAVPVGSVIKIPGYQTQQYTIKRGDTLYKLAISRGLPLDAVLLLNQQVSPENLQPGDQVQLPSRITKPVVEGQREYGSGDVQRDLNALLEIYPFLRRETAGKSVLENDITEVRAGSGPKKVHVNGSFHANEWITTPIIMTFLNDYLLSLTNNTPIRGLYTLPLYEMTELSLVPLVNPDGVDLVLDGPPVQEPYRSLVTELNKGSEDFSGWKANIRGVDLNNQYPARWEVEKERKPTAPAPRDYPGEAPLTEPEAIAMAELTRRRDFSRVLAFHTQGEEIYWGYLNMEPPEAETIVKEFQRVSGYKPVRFIDSYAGYKDWFIQEWRRPGYTVELGEGVNPLPLSQFDEIYQESLGIFLASLYM
ncbi:M14 family metallopeptidase [Bacillus marinisedimentorum]|uniref:M14 family metallopeptidase n=1 Tax=Bacillus marinisedimentorum TaxID=1821260 RepID=UPI000872E65B|nr:M14 family metallopeptidase [Bacillus marinisedimentorum]